MIGKQGKHTVVDVEEFKRKQEVNFDWNEFVFVIDFVDRNIKKEDIEKRIEFLKWAINFPKADYFIIEKVLKKFEKLAINPVYAKVILDFLRRWDVDALNITPKEHIVMQYRDTISLLELLLQEKCKCYEPSLYTYPELEDNIEIISSKVIKNDKKGKRLTEYKARCKVCGSLWIVKVWDDYDRKTREWHKIDNK